MLPPTSSKNAPEGVTPIPRLPFGISISPAAFALIIGSVTPLPEELSVRLPFTPPVPVLLVPSERFAVSELKKRVEPAGVPSPPKTKSSVAVTGVIYVPVVPSVAVVNGEAPMPAIEASISSKTPCRFVESEFVRLSKTPIKFAPDVSESVPSASSAIDDHCGRPFTT